MELCQCLNCETIMYDISPNEGQRRYSNQELEENNIHPVEMVQYLDITATEVDEDGSQFTPRAYGCPICTIESKLIALDADLV
jgi:hypothetical protein